MRKQLGMLMAVMLAIGLMLAPLAADAAMLKITGKVKDVDTNEKSLVVGGPDGDMVIYIDARSKITMGGGAKTLGDIKKGSIVEVRYQKQGDENMARVIRLTP